MGDPVTINLRHVARGLGVPLPQVEAVVELLDEGNTVPFITRYRKDQTGGLDEEQIRQIQSRLIKMRMLSERKQTILRSIESQGKLTEKLAKQIRGAGTTKRLEDLYLPYKPKKQTLAIVARGCGLEPLADEILAADPVCADLDGRAADFVNPDRQVPTPADALLGAGHILAERFSEQAELRQQLRDILQRTGRLLSSRIGGDPKPAAEKPKPTGPPEKPPQAPSEPAPQPAAEQPTEADAGPTEPQSPRANVPEAAGPAAEPPAETGDESPQPMAAAEPQGEQPSELAAEPLPEPGEASAEPPIAPSEAPTPPESPEAAAEPTEPAVAEQAPVPAASKPTTPPKPPKPAKVQRKLSKKELKKQKAEEKKRKAFSDYFDYSEEIKRIPPHRILAINRGERAKVLRVKPDYDLEAMHRVVEELCVPAEHPHADFLRGCARDALVRLILPSLEREIRRELTERAETHAVGVFARNLRNLLLQPPTHQRRVLAVDPGYRSGCKLVALDQFGNVLAHGVIYLVGKPDRRPQARELVCQLVDRFQLTVVAIGNGTACREAEDFFAELIGEQLKDRGVAYVIVNEAGASVYSTSRLGREEFPGYDATLRGAISIGRRLQDPLSELVKIDPANIGVGLYQHDVKAKHLRTSLDDVIESCVNYVGVDVNTASPALLRYVSGLNQLTARRLVQYRLEHGPFRTRERFNQIPGFGEATFVQAAGFLKITSGDNPLDATWIHPESYEIAGRVMAKLSCTPEGLREKGPSEHVSQGVANLKVSELAEEFQVGTLLLGDILAQLARPGRDPREDLPGPIFKQGVLKLEDLTPGMELTGTVLNVVDFGAFVDIGMHDSGLVHVSQLADKFIRDPHDMVAVGNIVKVWVLEVDKERRRVSLTMIRPGTRRPPRGHGAKPERPPAKDQRQEGEPGRKPRPKGPPRHRERRPPPKPHYKPKSRAKPVTPITDRMKTGNEPMRSFSDLAQFFQPDGESSEQSGGRKESKRKRKKPPRPPAEKPEAKDKAAEAPKVQDAAHDAPPAETPDVKDAAHEAPAAQNAAGEQAPSEQAPSEPAPSHDGQPQQAPSAAEETNDEAPGTNP